MNKPDIDEIFKQFYLQSQDLTGSTFKQEVQQAKTAIYEIGLEVIGRNEKYRRAASMGDRIHTAGRNSLRASQRKAWAKACGVAEK